VIPGAALGYGPPAFIPIRLWGLGSGQEIETVHDTADFRQGPHNVFVFT
jgi:hypothetical protein